MALGPVHYPACPAGGAETLAKAQAHDRIRRRRLVARFVAGEGSQLHGPVLAATIFTRVAHDGNDGEETSRQWVEYQVGERTPGALSADGRPCRVLPGGLQGRQTFRDAGEGTEEAAISSRLTYKSCLPFLTTTTHTPYHPRRRCLTISPPSPQPSWYQSKSRANPVSASPSTRIPTHSSSALAPMLS